jgi:hypothetical protein
VRRPCPQTPDCQDRYGLLQKTVAVCSKIREEDCSSRIYTSIQYFLAFFAGEKIDSSQDFYLKRDEDGCARICGDLWTWREDLEWEGLDTPDNRVLSCTLIPAYEQMMWFANISFDREYIGLLDKARISMTTKKCTVRQLRRLMMLQSTGWVTLQKEIWNLKGKPQPVTVIRATKAGNLYNRIHDLVGHRQEP